MARRWSCGGCWPVDRRQPGGLDRQDGQVAAGVSTDQPRGVLLAVRSRDRQIAVAFQNMSGGDHLVGSPDQAASGETTPAVDGDHGAASVLDSVGQIV